MRNNYVQINTTTSDCWRILFLVKLEEENES